MSQPDESSAQAKSPGSGPRYETLIDQLAAWMQERLAASALEEQHHD